MRNVSIGRLAGFTIAVLAAMAVTACGDTADSGQGQTAATQSPPNHVDATVTVTANSVGAAVQTGSPDETVAFAPDVTVSLNGPPGVDAIDVSNAFKVDDDQGVHLEPIPVTQPGKYEIVLAAGDGAMTLGNKKTGATVKIGTVRLGFERLADGTMLVPTSAKLSLPTSGSTTGDGAVFEGLPSGTVVTAQMRTETGTLLSKSATVPAGATSVTITNVGPGVDVSLLNGANSMLAVAASAAVTAQ